MYNVKGPSKIVAKTTRRGITQNMENNIREFTKSKSLENGDNEAATVPRPTFNKKPVTCHQTNVMRQEVISPQHEEIIKFITESWNSVCSDGCQDSDDSSSTPTTSKCPPQFYYEDEEPIHLEGFKPFDLESWWGKRLYACITGDK